MRSPKDFFRPLAVGAPQPLREIPFRPSRMIHFFDPSNPKMVAKVPDIASKVDVLLGNLEDAIQADNKEAARLGLVDVAKNFDGPAQLWTRVNDLGSPWVLDDITTLVTEIGDRLSVIMVPKVEGPWDIHYVDRLLAQLEARAGLERPILVHAILETSLGVANLEEIAQASPRMQGISLGPADLAASRRMKTTRVGGGHPGYLVLSDPEPGARLELGEQAIDVVDVPRPLDLRDHDHRQAVADLGHERRDVVERPRALERVHARPQRGLAEVDLAADADQAGPRGLLVLDRDRVLEVAEEDVGLGREIWQLADDLGVRGVEEMDHPRRRHRDLEHGIGSADGEGLGEVTWVAHR